MKKDELQEEDSYEASRRRYRERIGQFIDADRVESEIARELERTEEITRGRSIEEDRLLRDEDDAKTELPR